RVSSEGVITATATLAEPIGDLASTSDPPGLIAVTSNLLAPLHAVAFDPVTLDVLGQSELGGTDFTLARLGPDRIAFVDDQDQVSLVDLRTAALESLADFGVACGGRLNSPGVIAAPPGGGLAHMAPRVDSTILSAVSPRFMGCRQASFFEFRAK